MSSDSGTEDDMLMYYYFKYKRRNQRRFWIHPYIKRNINCRLFDAEKELQQTDEKFMELYRMSKESYLELKRLVAPAIQKRNTNMRECVSAEERILITLRYLATGSTFVTLSLYFARGDNTISRIVGETTKIFWEMLKDTYMPTPNTDQWKAIAQRFYSKWNIPNCLGAIDLKHIRIDTFTSKNYQSALLMASWDADGFFTLIEAGNGERNAGGVLPASAIKNWISNDKLNLPLPSKLPGDKNNNEFPYYFVGNESFPLARNLMKPYSQRALDDRNTIFNYRLSEGRKTIQSAFAMMTEKFQVLNQPLRCRVPDKVNDVIRSVCILHNFVRKREGGPSTLPAAHESPQITCDTIPPTRYIPITPQSPAHVLRNYLANYFVTSSAS